MRFKGLTSEGIVREPATRSFRRAEVRLAGLRCVGLLPKPNLDRHEHEPPLASGPISLGRRERVRTRVMLSRTDSDDYYLLLLQQSSSDK